MWRDSSDVDRDADTAVEALWCGGAILVLVLGGAAVIKATSPPTGDQSRTPALGGAAPAPLKPAIRSCAAPPPHLVEVTPGIIWTHTSPGGASVYLYDHDLGLDPRGFFRVISKERPWELAHWARGDDIMGLYDPDRWLAGAYSQASSAWLNLTTDVCGNRIVPANKPTSGWRLATWGCVGGGCGGQTFYHSPPDPAIGPARWIESAPEQEAGSPEQEIDSPAHASTLREGETAAVEETKGFFGLGWAGLVLVWLSALLLGGGVGGSIGYCFGRGIGYDRGWERRGYEVDAQTNAFLVQEGLLDDAAAGGKLAAEIDVVYATTYREGALGE